MTSLSECHRHSRHFGRDLLVLGPNGVYPVQDISPDGLSLKGKPFALGEIVTVTIASSTDDTEKIAANCQVVATSTTATHLAFAPVTMPLLTFIMLHIGTELGVAPYYFGARPLSPEPLAAGGS